MMGGRNRVLVVDGFVGRELNYVESRIVQRPGGNKSCKRLGTGFLEEDGYGEVIRLGCWGCM